MSTATITDAPIKTAKYVCTNAEDNNNKFWEYKQFADGTVITINGRVGKTSQEHPRKQMTQRALDALIKEKVEKKGYREIKILLETMPTGPSGAAESKAAVKVAAISQLTGGNLELTKLVERLVEANKHELFKASGGQMNIDLSTGIIQTPVGVVTKDNVIAARDHLNAMTPLVQKKDFDNKKFIETLNTYLMLVPQTVGHHRGWHHHFVVDNADLAKQTALLDQLEASADLAQARLEAAKNDVKKTATTTVPSLFNTKLEIVTDPKIIKECEKKYYDTLNRSHTSAALVPKRIYQVSLPAANDAFERRGAKLKNIWQLWHGTRMFNVLSILKAGLVIPRSDAFNVCGRMFGDGAYFSDQSTKSLNYAHGYWDRGAKDNNCFMFLFDVAMGDYYTPRGSYETLPKKGYDSTYAIGGQSGVSNNEMIIYSLDQCRPRFLIEFDRK